MSFIYGDRQQFAIMVNIGTITTHFREGRVSNIQLMEFISHILLDAIT